MIKDEIQFILNDKLIKVKDCDTNVTVLDYLRNYKKLTGTKEGCASGDCGACTSVIVELNANKLKYKSVNTCIMFLYNLHGKQLITIEHLEDKKLHPTQQAMIDNDGSQCGFCTPGFVMAMFGMYKNKIKPTNNNIDEYLAGNLCRCTGYKAIKNATKKMYSYGNKDKFSSNEKKITTLLKTINKNDVLIINDKKEFYIPITLKSLIKRSQKKSNFRFLSGGTDLSLEVTKQNKDINSIIYLGNNKDLNYINITKNYLHVGAATPINDLIPKLKNIYPSFANMFYRYGSIQIRNVATIGGNLASASPIGDSSPALLALNCSLIIQGNKQREININSFFKGYRKTTLKNNEFIKEIKIPILNKYIFKCYKVSKRFDDDISGIFVAFFIKLNKNLIIDIKIAFGGMAETPKLAIKTQKFLIGKKFNFNNILKSKNIIENEFNPISDMRASSQYRKIVSKNLLERFYLEISNNKSETIN